ncbi:hypothetical protein BEL04_02165 [Mucilaginibacter sp. PPCGB 2223]|uniref:hypothetical protein n=1 Tax=Mucilaginibacter sp. PPCGB 2223 TaxID=1886027 RepID=UPI000826F354|nr:hypothetical protein [Mucilaginibacter sp. PPCGB 2223]OCX53142.1 hypothetical protein BEL04_02165 [Mucilaginibacter sp. PPCGB 2223]
MLSVFNTLTKVNFNHSYFADGIFNALSVQISDATTREMNNNGLFLKAFRGGFHLLYDENYGASGRTRESVLNEGLTLQFVLVLKDNLFFNYTADVPEQLSTSVYYLGNRANTAGAVLHAGDFVSAKDIVAVADLKQYFFVKPFAILELVLAPDLQSECFIRFQSRATYWRYILMSGHLQQLNSPAIIDGEGGSEFGEPLSVTLPGNKEVKAFVSGSQMQLSQYPAKTFQLAENYQEGSLKYKVIIRALPQPDISAISKIPNHNSTNISDIFIY